MILEIFSTPEKTLFKNYTLKVADDPSGIYIHTTDPLLKALKATVVGTLVPQRPTEEIILADLRHLRTVKCLSRGPEGRKWMSNTEYSLYLLKQEFSHDRAVVFCVDGFGTEPFMIHQTAAHVTFPKLAEVLSEHELWDVFDAIIDTFRWGRNLGGQETAKKFKNAFLEGRLKKRKKKGLYEVSIVSELGVSNKV